MRFALLLLSAAALAAAGSGSTVTVRATDDLQRALNDAKPGDTILLERGATFAGNFVLPARASDGGGRVITLRSEGEASATPEGERMTPDAAAPFAKIHSPNGSPALATKPGPR